MPASPKPPVLTDLTDEAQVAQLNDYLSKLSEFSGSNIGFVPTSDIPTELREGDFFVNGGKPQLVVDEKLRTLAYDEQAQVVGAGKIFDHEFDIRNFDARKNDPKFDNAFAIKNAIDRAVLSGGRSRIVIPDGIWTFLTGNILLPDNVMIEGDGMGITILDARELKTQVHLFICLGTIGSKVTLTANATHGDTDISMASVSGFAKGDFVQVGSDDTFFPEEVAGGSPDIGQANRLIHVDTGANTLRLDSIVYSDRSAGRHATVTGYLTASNAFVRKITPIQNLTFKNFTVWAADNSEFTGSTALRISDAFLLRVARNIRFQDVQVFSSFQYGVRMYDVLEVAFTGMNMELWHNAIDDFEKGVVENMQIYGIGVGGYSRDLIVTQSDFYRHGECIVGISGDPVQDGVVRNVILEGNKFHGHRPFAAVNTHNQMDKVVVANSVAVNNKIGTPADAAASQGLAVFEFDATPFVNLSCVQVAGGTTSAVRLRYNIEATLNNLMIDHCPIGVDFRHIGNLTVNNMHCSGVGSPITCITTPGEDIVVGTVSLHNIVSFQFTDQAFDFRADDANLTIDRLSIRACHFIDNGGNRFNRPILFLANDTGVAKTLTVKHFELTSPFFQDITSDATGIPTVMGVINQAASTVDIQKAVGHFAQHQDVTNDPGGVNTPVHLFTDVNARIFSREPFGEVFTFYSPGNGVGVPISHWVRATRHGAIFSVHARVDGGGAATVNVLIHPLAGGGPFSALAVPPLAAGVATWATAALAGVAVFPSYRLPNFVPGDTVELQLVTSTAGDSVSISIDVSEMY